MAEHKGSWYPIGPVKWDGDKPYQDTSDGLRNYISPATAAQYQDDPRMLAFAKGQGAQLTKDDAGNITGETVDKAGQGILHHAAQWNSQSGQYDTPFDWGNLLSIGVGGAIAAPAVIGALGAAGGAAGVSGAASGGAGAALPSTAIGTGFIPGIAGGTGLGTAGAVGAGAAGAAGGAAAAAPALASTTIGTGAMAPITGSAGLAGGGSTGIAGAIGGAAKTWASDPTNWVDLAQNVGGQLSAQAQGRAQGRVQEADVNQAQDRNQIALYQALLNNNTAQNNFGLSRGSLANSNATTDLNQRQFALSAPGQRAGNAVRGDILANAQDATVSGVSPNIPVPTISGGLRPSMFSADTRALGANMSAQALREQQKGDTFAPPQALPDWQAPPAAPTLTATPEASGLDTALSTGGSILNTAGALGGTFADILKKYQQTKARPTTGMNGTMDTGFYAT